MSNFRNDLSRAQVLEQLVVNTLVAGGVAARLLPAPTREELAQGIHAPDFVVSTPDGDVGVDLKEDVSSAWSGNLAFERIAIEQGIESGTQAIMYCIRKNNQVIVFDAEALLQELQTHTRYYRQHVGDKRAGGASNPAWIVPLAIVLKFKSIITPLKPHVLTALEETFAMSYKPTIKNW